MDAGEGLLPVPRGLPVPWGGSMKPEEALGLLKAVAELERRIVKLEAYVKARREAHYQEARPKHL